MSDFIKVHWNDRETFVNAYAVSAVYVGGDGGTRIDLKLEGQTFFADESTAEVIDLVDAVTDENYKAGPVQVPTFPGMEKP